MECPDENVLLDAADGLLSGAGLEKIKQHASACERCRAALRDGARVTSTVLERRGGGEGSAKTVRELEAVPVAERDPLIGSTVGEYVVDEIIGSGGMGVVYAGHHPLIGRRVAIKVLRHELADDASIAARMLDEARAVNSIGGGVIADVFAFGELPDGRRYMVMEHLDGQPLGPLIRSGPLPLSRVLEVLDGLLAALMAAHAAGVIHRDLKPSNVFLVKDRAGIERVKLLDFGLAKRETTGPGLTVARRLVIGTPGYMAPEQIRVEPVSPRTDLYAVGVLAYELACGRRPFRGREAVAIMRAQLDSARPPLGAQRPDLPEAYVRLVDALLEADPGARPASAQEVRTRLAALQQPRRAQRRAVWLVLPATALVGIAFGVATVARQPEPDLPRERAVVTVAPAALAPPPAPAAPAAESAPEPTAAPASPEPRPDRSKQRVHERLAGMRRKVKARTPAGEEPDGVVTMLLQSAEQDLKRARTPSQVQDVERTLDEVERKYLR